MNKFFKFSRFINKFPLPETSLFSSNNFFRSTPLVNSDHFNSKDSLINFSNKYSFFNMTDISENDHKKKLDLSDDEDDSSPSKKKLKNNIRQHVNPLSSHHLVPAQISEKWLEELYPSYITSFADKSIEHRPILIDIGCAKGRWTCSYAQQNPSVNVLGLEIRQPAIDLCLQRKNNFDITNVNFLKSNINVDITTFINSINTLNVPISMICLQFPDPHFKKKHKKRRVITDEFVETLGQILKPNTIFFFQTDIQELGEYMEEIVSRSVYFKPSPNYDGKTLDKNPTPFTIPTEREQGILEKNEPVYRMMYYCSREV